MKSVCEGMRKKQQNISFTTRAQQEQNNISFQCRNMVATESRTKYRVCRQIAQKTMEGCCKTTWFSWGMLDLINPSSTFSLTGNSCFITAVWHFGTRCNTLGSGLIYKKGRLAQCSTFQVEAEASQRCSCSSSVRTQFAVCYSCVISPC